MWTPRNWVKCGKLDYDCVCFEISFMSGSGVGGLTVLVRSEAMKMDFWKRLFALLPTVGALCEDHYSI